MLILDVLLVNLAAVDGAPRIDDVSEDEGDEEADHRHRAQREVAGARVLDGERRLEVGG